jgi:hypothetical protein
MINRLLNLEREDEKLNVVVVAKEPSTYEIEIEYPDDVKYTKEDLYKFLKNEILSSL